MPHHLSHRSADRGALPRALERTSHVWLLRFTPLAIGRAPKTRRGATRLAERICIAARRRMRCIASAPMQCTDFGAPFSTCARGVTPIRLRVDHPRLRGSTTRRRLPARGRHPRPHHRRLNRHPDETTFTRRSYTQRLINLSSFVTADRCFAAQSSWRRRC